MHKKLERTVTKNNENYASGFLMWPGRGSRRAIGWQEDVQETDLGLCILSVMNHIMRNVTAHRGSFISDMKGNAFPALHSSLCPIHKCKPSPERPLPAAPCGNEKLQFEMPEKCIHALILFLGGIR